MKTTSLFSNQIKMIAVFLLGLFIQTNAMAQVSHLPENKNFLIERGTGLACGSCPKITLFSDTIINDFHPGRGMLIEYHTGPDARPQGGGISDFQSIYGDSLEHSIGFGLNMAVNRRDQSQANYNNYTFIYPPGVPLAQCPIEQEVSTIINTPSPLNLAMTSSYNPQTRVITANVEVYYTANGATNINLINIALTEDSLFGMQYDGMFPGWNPNFNHLNLFRDQLTPMWGDTIQNTTQGTTISRTYTYTVPATYGAPNYTTVCKPLKCNLTLYVTEEKNNVGGWNQKPAGKVITAIRTKVGVNPNSIAENKSDAKISVYPNPTNGICYIGRTEGGNCSIEVIDMLGKNVFSTVSNTQQTEVDLSTFENGVYFIKISSEKGSFTNKVILSK